jgi:cell division protein FtsI (penicillin-binding protein 3)
VTIVLVAIMLMGLSGRLLQLQGLDSTAYAARAEAQRQRVTVLPAIRGSITDRSGRPLAVDVDVRLVYADPKEVTDVAGTAARLSGPLGMPATQLLQLIETAPRGSRYVVLQHRMTVPAGRAVAALRLPGIGVAREVRRDHPAGAVGAQVVGVSGAQDNGLSGVELRQQAVLAGHAGRLEEETDPLGRVIPQGVSSETPARDGRTIRLTLDRDLQWQAQTALDAQVKATHSRGGHVIVMDPRSGDLLALASSPGFDPTRGYTAKDLHLGAVEDVYEPGSVNKVVTAAAALQGRVVNPLTPIVVPPTYEWPGRPQLINDAEPHGQETLTFTGVLAESSNIGTDIVARMLGNATIYHYLRAFGLGSTTGIPLPGESAGLLPDVAGWNPSQSATIPFGQGMSATALQFAQIYATIANGGIRMTPHLVAGATGDDGVFRAAQRPAGVRVVSPQVAHTLARMLEAVTTDSNGTGTAAQIPGYRVAGKTGTAQALSRGPDGVVRYDGGFVSSFIGFAPADAPRLLVEVVLDHPQGAHFGGVVAAPVFKQVMGFALREFAIPPTGTRAPTFTLRLDK